MRLSEAILLGSVSIEWVAAMRFDYCGRQMGCALGMAEYSVGKFRQPSGAESEWPWIGLKYEQPMYPCGCCKTLPHSTNCTVIAQTFNCHVMGKKNWTLDRLVDWVRSVEPAESPESLPTHAGKIIDESIAMVEQAEKQAKKI